jgi:hypothetical protein
MRSQTRGDEGSVQDEREFIPNELTESTHSTAGGSERGIEERHPQGMEIDRILST